MGLAVNSKQGKTEKLKKLKMEVGSTITEHKFHF